ncbi:MAG: cysteine desulfurase [Erysipelotrichaceae bacterium]|nr:cysteine desulfurase [Erysipelotrichaceae bacterium]
MKKIYLDTVSTTRPDPAVIKTYEDLLEKTYVNSDALYDDGVTLYNLQEDARKRVASLLGVSAEEVIFTSGASEANSLAIKGCAWAHPEKKHLITSIYEHSSVYGAASQLERLGWKVTYLRPDKEGKIAPQAVREALRPDTVLVSIMFVNNELGSINDVKTIAEIVKKESHACFHCDITQALGKIPVDLTNIDLASFSAHKIHGLKGSGALIRRRHVPLEPLVSGGQQEGGLRGGTSNAPLNIVLAKTLRLALEQQPQEEAHDRRLKEVLLQELQEIPEVTVNSPADGIANLVSLSTPVKSEVLLNALNKSGIMVSSRSTCGSRKNEPSRVLTSMGIDDERAIRVSFDRENTEEEILLFTKSLKEIIKKYG